MLKIGSNVNIYDTSGALKVQILNMKKKKTYKKSYLNPTELFLGVIKEAELDKKLKKRNFITVILVGAKKKRHRGNGIFINFSENRGIPLKISRFIVPVAVHVFTPVVAELHRLKKFRVVARSAGPTY